MVLGNVFCPSAFGVGALGRGICPPCAAGVVAVAGRVGAGRCAGAPLGAVGAVAGRLTAVVAVAVCVGLGAGGGFVDTIVNDGGYVWVGYGVLITVIPLLIAGFVARRLFKLNYYTLIGVLSGSMTNPPALAYSNEQTGSDSPSVGYATVYPLTMFLRVLTAQLLIIFFV